MVESLLITLREGFEAALVVAIVLAAVKRSPRPEGAPLGLVRQRGGGRPGHRHPLRCFFQVTGVLIILFAAGLVSRGGLFLQSAGDLGPLDNAVYNLTGQR
jgi:high-affinity iron transporter